MMLLLLQLYSHIVICALPLHATASAKHPAAIIPQNTTIVAAQGPESFRQLYFQNSQTEEKTEEVTEESRLYTFQDYTVTFILPLAATHRPTQFLASTYLSIPSGLEPDPPQYA